MSASPKDGPAYSVMLVKIFATDCALENFVATFRMHSCVDDCYLDSRHFSMRSLDNHTVEVTACSKHCRNPAIVLPVVPADSSDHGCLAMGAFETPTEN